MTTVRADVPTLSEAVDATAHRQRRRVAVVDTSHADSPRVLDYGTLAGAAATLARDLHRAGVRAGRPVAVHGDPTAQAIVAMLALDALGAVWVGLNPRHRSRELATVLAAARPTHLLLLDAPVAGSAASVALEVAVEQGCRIVRVNADLRADAIADGDFAGSRPVLAGTAAVVFTSGSTGAPKGAIISRQALAGCCEVAARRWRADLAVVVCDLPINHVGFIGDLVGTALRAGTTLVLRRTFDPAATLTLIKEYEVSAWTGVPAMFAAITNDRAFERAELGSVRRVLWAGASISTGVLQRLSDRTSAPLTGLYGSTESVGNVAEADSTWLPRHALSRTLGRPTPPYRLRVVDSAGAEVGPGGTGALEVGSPYLFSGYLNQPAATAAAFTVDGWLRTGDRGTVDEDGNVDFAGRSDQLFKTGGYFVDPAEVEQQLHTLDGVIEAVVVPIPDPERGLVPAAMVLGPPHLDPDVIRRHARTVLASYKIPRSIKIVDEIPRLPLGKADRTCVAAVLSQPTHAPHREGPHDQHHA